MPEHNEVAPITAKIKSHNRISTIWFIPLVALAIAAWMIIDGYVNRGPQITITFATAEGLEAGKTRVKTLNVDVGYVTKVMLHNDGVIAHVKLDKQVAHLLTDVSHFWIVKPRIGNGGITGLSTLASGSYIEFVPSVGDVAVSNEFIGLEQEPITAVGVPGLRLNLVSDKGDSLSIGEPVFYRGFEVGKVEQSTFDIKNREVHYQIFVKSPYSELLTSNTYFWNSSGIDFKADTQGIKVNVGSLESIISGGVTFDVPTDLPLGDDIDTGKKHILYPDKDSVYERRQYKSKELIVLFEDSIRGLNIGAPVEYRGIRIGTVANIDNSLTIHSTSIEQRIPVLIKLEPARLGFPDDNASIEEVSRFFDSSIKQGLRATLKSGSLLTGSLFVDLDYYAIESDSTLNAKYNGKPVIPSMSGSLAQIEEKVFAILDKFSTMPIDVTIGNINTMLSSANKTIIGLNDAVSEVKGLISNQQTQAIPESINDTLNKLSTTLDSYNQQAPVYTEIEESLNQFQQLMREIQPLVKELNNKPNSLIFKGQNTNDPEPKGIKK